MLFLDYIQYTYTYTYIYIYVFAMHTLLNYILRILYLGLAVAVIWLLWHLLLLTILFSSLMAILDKTHNKTRIARIINDTTFYGISRVIKSDSYKISVIWCKIHPTRVYTLKKSPQCDINSSIKSQLHELVRKKLTHILIAYVLIFC